MAGSSRDAGFHRSQSESVTAESGLALVQQPGADQMGGHILVPEAEPGGLGAVGRQLLLDRPGLADPSPAALGVGAAAQRIHDAVEIGTDRATRAW